jgi:hypothetical protein
MHGERSSVLVHEDRCLSWFERDAGRSGGSQEQQLIFGGRCHRKIKGLQDLC